MATIATQPSILEHPSLEQLLQGVPADVNDFTHKHWDKGVFSLELLDLAITPSSAVITDGGVSNEHKTPIAQIRKGTYGGTQLALTEIYSRIENRYVNFTSCFRLTSKNTKYRCFHKMLLLTRRHLAKPTPPIVLFLSFCCRIMNSSNRDGTGAR